MDSKRKVSTLGKVVGAVLWIAYCVAAIAFLNWVNSVGGFALFAIFGVSGLFVTFFFDGLVKAIESRL